MAKKIKNKGIDKRLIRTCPACGYSFKPVNPRSNKKIKSCPMCDHKFIEPNEFINPKDNQKKRFFSWEPI